MFPKKMKQAEERLANQLQKQANSNKENIKWKCPQQWAIQNNNNWAPKRDRATNLKH
jgi:sarcosine oxidase gamma subunit